MSATTTASASESRDSSKSQLVVVDLGQPQPSVEVDLLTKGKGKLLTHVDQIVKDLVSKGTVKSGAQPVVIVVREYPVPPWFSAQDDDDD